MQTAQVSTKILAASMVAILAITILPLAAFAQTEIKSTEIVQVAPAGANTCAQLTPRFQAYVYDGAINSFDISVSDPSYVAIVASVGNWSVPLNYMTRRVGPTATTVHMDTPSIPVGKGLPVTVILLSAKGQGAPLCAMTVNAVVGGQGITTVNTSTGTGNSYTPPVSGNPSWEEEVIVPIVEVEEGKAVRPVVGAGIKSSLDKICSTASGATRLWTVLLAVYLLVIAATILAQPTSRPTNGSAALLGAAIALPLLVLLGIWGFAPDCRIGGWVPVAALIIAAAGCIFGYRSYPQFAKLFSPPENK